MTRRSRSLPGRAKSQSAISMSGWRRPTSPRPPTCSGRCTRRAAAATALSAWKCRPTSRWTPQGRSTEARRLWRAVDRPNIFIKVPATAPSLPAIRQLLAEGININITLLFAQAVYQEVIEAYLNALEERAAAGAPIDRIASVASFFVSRIDTAADKLMAETIARTSDEAERAALAKLAGKVAVANAKAAYRLWQKCFSGPRWERLAKARRRGRSSCCGPRPEPKIPLTATSSMSRS